MSATTANKMTDMINKIERRLGLLPLTPHLPDYLNKEEWANVVETDTLVTFSRYYPYKIPFLVNRETCDIRTEHHQRVYYIKDEYLKGLTLLGASDIDWTDFSSDNLSVTQTQGYGYYTPDYMGCPICTFETIMYYQMMADFQSLYNRGIFLEFKYPNKIILTGSGNVSVNLEKFVINLLVQHPANLSTISPTIMETFEALAQADIANFLQKNLRYYDGLETVYMNIDLKLSELEQEASKRDGVIEDLKNSYVSASNDSIPYILTV